MFPRLITIPDTSSDWLSRHAQGDLTRPMIEGISASQWRDRA